MVYFSNMLSGLNIVKVRNDEHVERTADFVEAMLKQGDESRSDFAIVVPLRILEEAKAKLDAEKEGDGSGSEEETETEIDKDNLARRMSGLVQSRAGMKTHAARQGV